ncbi:hypothetical protein [Natronomonas sp.]|uniref:hypothetical protein n=1 Tax=Natronomonas sp. TaxID=2184060 RepID=UPI002FC3A7E9
MTTGALPPDATTRESVRFYLLDHRTPIGKAIDIGLLILNLLFVAIYVLETYSLESLSRESLWTLEIGLVLVFLIEWYLKEGEGLRGG